MTLALVMPWTLQAQRAPVAATHGMVASSEAYASEVGAEILRRGGNAVDAAVATGLALAVTYPRAGNLGGGGFMLIHLADGRDVVIDYRETAPAAATANMFLGPDGKALTGTASSTLGWRASGVPGTVAGFALAVKKYGSGKLTWAELVEPARRLAAEGHVLSQAAAGDLASYARKLGRFAESKKVFLGDGQPCAAGGRWVQADLGATLARLQEQGPREFYEGETARRIAAAMAQHGGLITAADLKGYVAVERTPLRGTYRGCEIVTVPPPSSGGIALLSMLAMLEPFDLAAIGHNSAAKYHLLNEVMRRAFRDRAEFLGDPDFVTVPVAGLLDRDYLRGRMADFDPQRASVSAGYPAGKPAGASARPAANVGRKESPETTHYSVIDAAGNVVANTYTLNGLFGSGVTVPGTGILLNNEMDDFAVQLGVPNMFGLIQGEANVIAPGKRPLSSMTPTMVFREGKLLLVTGSPGGPTIINTVLQVILNVVDHRMPVTQAVEASRVHHQWLPDVLTYERFGLSADTAALLRAMGHTLKERDADEGSYQGGAESIARDPATGRWLGAADPRKPDSKAVGF
ncbi:MAG: gamma-glutamyltransferase [Opitutae bacterium]|nr:gamma-glutamyltransferase [Opitutae bacterium]